MSIVRKLFAATGIGSHSKMTTQLEIKRLTVVSLEIPLKKLNEKNKPRLIAKNFSLAIPEHRFPNFSPGLS